MACTRGRAGCFPGEMPVDLLPKPRKACFSLHYCGSTVPSSLAIVNGTFWYLPLFTHPRPKNWICTWASLLVWTHFALFPPYTMGCPIQQQCRIEAVFRRFLRCSCKQQSTKMRKCQFITQTCLSPTWPRCSPNHASATSRSTAFAGHVALGTRAPANTHGSAVGLECSGSGSGSRWASKGVTTQLTPSLIAKYWVSQPFGVLRCPILRVVQQGIFLWSLPSASTNKQQPHRHLSLYPFHRLMRWILTRRRCSRHCVTSATLSLVLLKVWLCLLQAHSLLF